MTLTPEAEVTRSSSPVTEALFFGLATKLWNKSKAFNTGDFITFHKVLSVTVNEDVCRVTTCHEYFNTCVSKRNTWIHTYNSRTVFWKRNCSVEKIKQPYILVALSDLLEPIITNFKGFSSDESDFSSEHSHDTHWCWCVYTALTVFVIISFNNNEPYKYSIGWFIRHLQDQRFAKHCTSIHWNIIPNVHLCVPSSHMAKHNSLILSLDILLFSSPHFPFLFHHY